MRQRKATKYNPETGLIERVPITHEEHTAANAWHYREGEDFFGLFLDPDYLNYSCADWRKAETEEESVRFKHEAIANNLEAEPGKHILEVGGGFGSLSRYLAEERGCKVTCFNVSKPQHDYCVKNAPAGVTYINDSWTNIPEDFTADAAVNDESSVHATDKLELFEKINNTLEIGNIYVDKELFITHRNYDCADRLNMANLAIFGNVGHYPSLGDTLLTAGDASFLTDKVETLPSYNKTSNIWLKRMHENYPKLLEINDVLARDTKRMFKIYNYIFSIRPVVTSVHMVKFIACDPEKYG